MNRIFKYFILPTAFITLIFAILGLFILQCLNLSHRTSSNQETAQLIGLISEHYPDLDPAEIVHSLNQPASASTLSAGQNILKSYGYTSADYASPAAAIYSLQITAVLLGLLVLNGLAVLTYFSWRDYATERRIAELVTYLQNLRRHVYDLRLAASSEDQLSLLSSELYKITILLQTSAQTNRQKSQQLETALADISHQLRTPLTSLQIMIDNLYAEPNMPLATRQDFLRTISQQLDNMTNLITALLNLAKFDNGSIKLHSRPVLLSELTTATIDNLAILADLHDVSLLASGDLSTHFKLDLHWQTEALTNIVKNCIEHSPAGSTVQITVQNSPLFLKIIVSDSGEGIAASDLRHIFDRFYKTQNSSPTSVGIGLSFAKAIITAEHGQIKVTSTPGQGTTFTISYPK